MASGPSALFKSDVKTEPHFPCAECDKRLTYVPRSNAEGSHWFCERYKLWRILTPACGSRCGTGEGVLHPVLNLPGRSSIFAVAATGAPVGVFFFS